MYSLWLRLKIAGQYIWTDQVGTLIMLRDLYLALTISCRISSSGTKTRNWLCLTSILCGIWWRILRSSIHEGRHNTPKLERFCATNLTKWCTRAVMAGIAAEFEINNYKISEPKLYLGGNVENFQLLNRKYTWIITSYSYVQGTIDNVQRIIAKYGMTLKTTKRPRKDPLPHRYQPDMDTTDECDGILRGCGGGGSATNSRASWWACVEICLCQIWPCFKCYHWFITYRYTIVFLQWDNQGFQLAT